MKLQRLVSTMSHVVFSGKRVGHRVVTSDAWAREAGLSCELRLQCGRLAPKFIVVICRGAKDARKSESRKKGAHFDF